MTPVTGRWEGICNVCFPCSTIGVNHTSRVAKSVKDFNTVGSVLGRSEGTKVRELESEPSSPGWQGNLTSAELSDNALV